MNSNTHNARNMSAQAALGLRVANAGEGLIRATIIIVLGWVGAMKFTGYEAGAIKGLVESSPLTSWLYAVTSLQGASNLIGTVEILTALVLMGGVWSARASVIGAAGAAVTFFVTSTLLLTASVTEPTLGGFPSLSVVPGQFLLKDLVLLAAAVFLLGRSLQRTDV